MASAVLHSFIIHELAAQNAVPVVVNHVVEDFPAGEVILSARLLVAFGGSCGV